MTERVFDVAALAAESLYIGGKWLAGEAVATPVHDSATAETIIEVPGASSTQVDAALHAAMQAQVGWARTAPSVRAKLLRDMATVMRDHVPALSELIMQETGKVQALSQAEVEVTAQFLEFSAEWALRIEGEILYSDTDRENILLQREPLGVVAAICAWNWPVAIMARKLAPALITGNAVVVKPSEVTPLSSVLALRLWDQHLGLPPGVLNLITGDGDVGRALVCHPTTNMVTFTGHRDTGKRIMADAAPNLTRVALELGGKAPAIVLKDADLDTTIPALVGARFATSGQQCGAAERILVERPILEEFTERFAEAVGALTVGAPHSSCDLGPLVNAEQVDKVSRAVATAVEQGATIVTGGGRPSGADFEKGYYFAPTVIGNVNPSMTIATEETFGPVIPIISVDSFDEAIKVANDSRYGLAGYLYTTSYASAMRGARDINVGELFINRSVGEALHAHHGGHKESGYGGEDGKHGLLKYTQIKVVYHNW